ncbi:MAG: hypothetical protein ABSC03_18310 [Verrucomicrobiota bacterium]|jgi:hypothetical protein
MGLKRRLAGGMLATVGYMLSPLSWWNDLFVNVPLALAFAWIVSLFWAAAFTASFVVGYWLTNVLGLVLLHRGAQDLITGRERRYSRKDLARDVLVALAYTLLILVLIKVRVLRPLPDYLPHH